MSSVSVSSLKDSVQKCNQTQGGLSTRKKRKLGRLEDLVASDIYETSIVEENQPKKVARKKLSFLPKINLEIPESAPKVPPIKLNRVSLQKKLLYFKIKRHAIEAKSLKNLKRRKRRKNSDQFHNVKQKRNDNTLEALNSFKTHNTMKSNQPITENKTNSIMFFPKELYVSLVPLEKTNLLNEKQRLELNIKKTDKLSSFSIEKRDFNLNTTVSRSFKGVDIKPCKVILKRFKAIEIANLTAKKGDAIKKDSNCSTNIFKIDHSFNELSKVHIAPEAHTSNLKSESDVILNRFSNSKAYLKITNTQSMDNCEESVFIPVVSSSPIMKESGKSRKLKASGIGFESESNTTYSEVDENRYNNISKRNNSDVATTFSEFPHISGLYNSDLENTSITNLDSSLQNLTRNDTFEIKPLKTSNNSHKRNSLYMNFENSEKQEENSNSNSSIVLKDFDRIFLSDEEKSEAHGSKDSNTKHQIGFDESIEFNNILHDSSLVSLESTSPPWEESNNQKEDLNSTYTKSIVNSESNTPVRYEQPSTSKSINETVYTTKPRVNFGKLPQFSILKSSPPRLEIQNKKVSSSSNKSRRVTFNDKSVIIIEDSYDGNSDRSFTIQSVPTNFPNDSDCEDSIINNSVIVLSDDTTLEDTLNSTDDNISECSPVIESIKNVNKLKTDCSPHKKMFSPRLSKKITNNKHDNALIEHNKRTNSDERNKLVSRTSLVSNASPQRTKIPNFAKIHSRMYAKMLGLDEYNKHKKERAELLLSGKKPPSSLFSKKLQNSSTEIVNKKLQFACSTPNGVKNEKNGFTKYGFKLRSNENGTRKEQFTTTASKIRPAKKVTPVVKNEIKGVRCNRRFELLMQLRKKNTNL